MKIDAQMNVLLAQLSAENLGQLTGALLALSLFVGIGVLAIVCIVKAFTKKTRGWIVAGCISAALLCVPLIAVLVAFVKGVQSGIRSGDSVSYPSDSEAQSRGRSQAPIPATSSPKTAPTHLIRGRDIDYSLSVPVRWTTKMGVQAFDSLNNYKSLYVGVIAEESNLGSPEIIAKISRNKIKEVGTDISWTEPAPLILDGRSWLQYTVDCKFEKIPLSYQFYVYAGREGTFQVVGWTTQDLFRRDASFMREVMATFHFPE